MITIAMRLSLFALATARTAFGSPIARACSA